MGPSSVKALSLLVLLWLYVFVYNLGNIITVGTSGIGQTF